MEKEWDLEHFERLENFDECQLKLFFENPEEVLSILAKFGSKIIRVSRTSVSCRSFVRMLTMSVRDWI